MARVLDAVANPFMITPSDSATWFGVLDKTAREWLKEWSELAFINAGLTETAQRVRNYVLADKWIEAFFQNNGSQFLK